MTRILARYSETRLRDVLTMQREAHPGIHDQLLADYCAEVLTGGCGDDAALSNAAEQVLALLAREHVERGR